MLDLSAGTEHYRLAQLALSERRIPDCLELLERAEHHGYSPNDCAACRWDCCMMLGRLEEAWRQSDAIAARGICDPNCLWDGLPFTGKRVIIRCVHGFGDAIQFVRYAKQVRCQARSVTVQTHPQLVPLFGGIDGIDRVTTWSDGPGLRGRDWDQQIEVMELPRAFRTTVETIPAEIPYLRVTPELVRRSRKAMGPRRRPRVGLLWEASDWNVVRNVPFAQFRQILEIPGVDFFSFQRGVGRDELIARGLTSRVRDFAGDSPDVTYFAADLVNMDLLITVDTMAAHLAGALGTRVWVLLPFEADWRWMLHRADSPWYPGMKLFRQTSGADWYESAGQVARELNRFAGGSAAALGDQDGAASLL